MASASARALRVLASVLIAVPLIFSEPLLMPLACTPGDRVVPALPKLPPVTVPSWNVRVLARPAPMPVVALRMPFVASDCAWASWVTLTS